MSHKFLVKKPDGSLGIHAMPDWNAALLDSIGSLEQSVAHFKTLYGDALTAHTGDFQALTKRINESSERTLGTLMQQTELERRVAVLEEANEALETRLLEMGAALARGESAGLEGRIERVEAHLQRLPEQLRALESQVSALRKMMREM